MIDRVGYCAVEQPSRSISIYEIEIAFREGGAARMLLTALLVMHTIRLVATNETSIQKFLVLGPRARGYRLVFISAFGASLSNPSWVRRKSDSLDISTVYLTLQWDEQRTCALQTRRNCTRLYLF